MPILTQEEFHAVRRGIANLPRADNTPPGAQLGKADVFTPRSHRSTLDPDRTLVVGNRGTGKSFWAHALLDPDVRAYAAEVYMVPQLKRTHVVLGFNAGERSGELAPPPGVIQAALKHGVDAGTVWQAVLCAAASQVCHEPVPGAFGELCHWVAADAERASQLATRADSMLQNEGRQLLILFDALEHLAKDWANIRRLTQSLLRLALAARSYRAIRFKVLMRADQFQDLELFAFPDASKIRNTHADLTWTNADLYGLLCHHLGQPGAAQAPFQKLHNAMLAFPGNPARVLAVNDYKPLVDALAGEYMRSGAISPEKGGRVYSWLPLHLADGFGATSPRTFLTAFREAALHEPPPSGKSIDHAGISEGVRKASADRLGELKEDYPWIGEVLDPLRGHLVPMEPSTLEEIWRSKKTVASIQRKANSMGWLAPIELAGDAQDALALQRVLKAIGILEIRKNGKINIPDIFRVEAGIKRKGGVTPPRRGTQV